MENSRVKIRNITKQPKVKLEDGEVRDVADLSYDNGKLAWVNCINEDGDPCGKQHHPKEIELILAETKKND